MDTNQILLKNLQAALLDSDTLKKVERDFKKTFHEIGLCVMQPAPCTMEVLRYIREATSMEEAEKNIKELFASITCDGEKFFVLLNEALVYGRTPTIFEQIIPYLKDVGNVIDYGCGNGTLAQMLHNKCGIDVEGVDVRDFRAENVSIPITVFDGYHVPVSDKHYECGIAITVIHHDADNEKILQELDRTVSKKLVIIETVPEADNEESAKKDWGRMLLNDALFNRFFNYADIPVPGTYDIPSNWIKRFERYGWKCTHSEDLGFDQPTIQDRHYLFVFEK